METNFIKAEEYLENGTEELFLNKSSLIYE